MTKRDHDRARALSELTAIAYRSTQSKMAVLKRREAEHLKALAEIEEDRRARLADFDGNSAAGWTGAVMSWQVWIDGQKRKAMTDVFKIRAAIEDLKPRLARDFGRHETSDRLATRLRDESVKATKKR